MLDQAGPEFDKSSDPTVANPDFIIQGILAYAKRTRWAFFCM